MKVEGMAFEGFSSLGFVNGDGIWVYETSWWKVGMLYLVLLMDCYDLGFSAIEP